MRLEVLFEMLDVVGMVANVVVIEPPLKLPPRQPQHWAGLVVRLFARSVALDGECFRREVAESHHWAISPDKSIVFFMVYRPL
jgi:hypothetical protein